MHHTTIVKAELQTGDGMHPDHSLLFIYDAEVASHQMFEISEGLLMADNQQHEIS